MRDSTDSAPGSEEHGPAARLQRATQSVAIATRDQAFRRFIDHAQTCADCIAAGIDCQLAADLKQIWRTAKEAAA